MASFISRAGIRYVFYASAYFLFFECSSADVTASIEDLDYMDQESDTNSDSDEPSDSVSEESSDSEDSESRGSSESSEDDES